MDLLPVYLVTFCYNEKPIIHNTISYYKDQFPDIHIIIYDNHSTDESRSIAESFGCEVRVFGKEDKKENLAMADIKNNIWKTIPRPSWVIIVDMDEWICLNQKGLLEEQEKGTTIIRLKGYQLIAASKTKDLSDIDLFQVSEGFLDDDYDKTAIFRNDCIQETSYGPGAHYCNPKGKIVYPDKPYYLYHYKYLGTEYMIDNYLKNFIRTIEDREYGMAVHYSDDIQTIASVYADSRAKATSILPIHKFMT